MQSRARVDGRNCSLGPHSLNNLLTSQMLSLQHGKEVKIYSLALGSVCTMNRLAFHISEHQLRPLALQKESH